MSEQFKALVSELVVPCAFRMGDGSVFPAERSVDGIDVVSSETDSQGSGDEAGRAWGS